MPCIFCLLFLSKSANTKGKAPPTTEPERGVSSPPLPPPLFLDDGEGDKFIPRGVCDAFLGYNRFIGDVASWSAPHDWTVSDVYMSVTKDIVDTDRYYMCMFCEREGMSSSSDNSGGLPIVYALYKFADYFMPLANIVKAACLKLLCK